LLLVIPIVRLPRADRAYGNVPDYLHWLRAVFVYVEY
jgi:hypothetical protein